MMKKILSKPSILLVENDPSLAWTIEQTLVKSNFVCTRSRSLAQSYQKIESNDYDVIILDRLLDDGDSIELIEYLKDAQTTARTLVLSQLNDVAERINGLKAGADDYLGKPFSSCELLLRVENLIGSQKIQPLSVLSSGPLTLFPDQGKLMIIGQEVKLRKREMQILEHLVRQKGRVVSRQAIVNHVWGMSGFIPSFVTLDVYIRRIRVALGTYKFLLQTVRGFGYTIAFPEESAKSVLTPTPAPIHT